MTSASNRVDVAELAEVSITAAASARKVTIASQSAAGPVPRVDATPRTRSRVPAAPAANDRPVQRPRARAGGTSRAPGDQQDRGDDEAVDEVLLHQRRCGGECAAAHSSAYRAPGRRPPAPTARAAGSCRGRAAPRGARRRPPSRPAAAERGGQRRPRRQGCRRAVRPGAPRRRRRACRSGAARYHPPVRRRRRRCREHRRPVDEVRAVERRARCHCPATTREAALVRRQRQPQERHSDQRGGAGEQERPRQPRRAHRRVCGDGLHPVQHRHVATVPRPT